MILNTGCRTDIPAYFSKWFYNRVQEGFVMVRNPYNPQQVTRYRISPDVVDAMVFCTKNPAPMLPRLQELNEYGQFWCVTITPYGKDIEPNVPDKDKVMESVIKLSEIVGKQAVSWRYDPIFISEEYNVECHIRSFEQMAKTLHGHTNQCVVSFVDLYAKTKRNFPSVREVTAEEQETLIEAFSKIAKEHELQIHLCCEKPSLARDHVDSDGCMTQAVIETAIGCSLHVPKIKTARPECNCLLGADIGVYNTCGHGCLYCYANYDQKSVARNQKLHDWKSPFLIGDLREEDKVKVAEQKSWKDQQMNLFDFM